MTEAYTQTPVKRTLLTPTPTPSPPPDSFPYSFRLRAPRPGAAGAFTTIRAWNGGAQLPMIVGACVQLIARSPESAVPTEVRNFCRLRAVKHDTSFHVVGTLNCVQNTGREDKSPLPVHSVYWVNQIYLLIMNSVPPTSSLGI